MTEAEILARFAKAREFVVPTARGWKFTLRLPSDFQERRAAIDAAALRSGGAWEVWGRDMVVTAVVGWEGPTLDDLLDEGDTTPLPFSPGLAPVLLENDLPLLDEITLAYQTERKARNEKIGAAVKN